MHLNFTYRFVYHYMTNICISHRYRCIFHHYMTNICIFIGVVFLQPVGGGLLACSVEFQLCFTRFLGGPGNRGERIQLKPLRKCKNYLLENDQRVVKVVGTFKRWKKLTVHIIQTNRTNITCKERTSLYLQFWLFQDFFRNAMTELNEIHNSNFTLVVISERIN